jgi:hypothetical protein
MSSFEEEERIFIKLGLNIMSLEVSPQLQFLIPYHKQHQNDKLVRQEQH